MKFLAIFETNHSLVVTGLRSRGHEVTVLPNKLNLTIPFPYDGTLKYGEQTLKIDTYDAVLLFQIDKISRYLYNLLSPHCLVIGNPNTRCIMRDKVATAILLDNNGIDVVPSLYSQGYVDMARCANLGEDLVEKPVDGSLGQGVVLHRGGLTEKVYNKIIQKYIDCNGTDERWIIVDGIVVCAEQRESSDPESEFRSSLALGGTGTPIPVTPEMQELGKKVYDCFPGCVWTGIDVIREAETDDVYVGECNSNPLRAIIEITGHNFFDDICNYIISQIPVKENQ